MQDHRRNIRPSAQIFSCKPLLMERFLSTTQFEHLDPYIAVRPAHTRKKGIEEQVFRMQKLEKLRQQHQEFNNFSYSNSSICMPNSYSFNTFENDLSGVSCPIDTTTQNLALEVQHPPPAKRGRKRKSAPISQEEGRFETMAANQKITDYCTMLCIRCASIKVFLQRVQRLVSNKHK